MKLRVRLVIAFLLIAAFTIDRAAYAQVTTGAIHGTVTDPAGAVVPNVDITVLNTSNGISVGAKSDGSGFFRVTHLQIGGPYTISVAAAGFSNFSEGGIQLNVNHDR